MVVELGVGVELSCALSCASLYVPRESLVCDHQRISLNSSAGVREEIEEIEGFTALNKISMHHPAFRLTHLRTFQRGMWSHKFQRP